MALVPHKITALAESDAQGTDGKNIVAGAVVSLYDTNGTVVTLFDDASGANGSTTKQTDATGQVVVYVTPGEYDEEVNGSVKRRVSIGGNGLTSYPTTASLESSRPTKTGQRAENRERANAQYKLAAEGYTALAGDVVAANGRVWELQQSDNGWNVKHFGAVGDNINEDSTAIQNTIDRAAGGRVYAPASSYKLGSKLNINVRYTSIVGDGVNATRFICDSHFMEISPLTLNSGDSIDEVTLKDFSAFRKGADDIEWHGIQERLATGTYISNVTLYDFTYGHTKYGCRNTGHDRYRILSGTSLTNNIADSYGIKFTYQTLGDGGEYVGFTHKFDQSFITSNLDSMDNGLVFEACDVVQFNNSYIGRQENAAIKFASGALPLSATSITFENTYFDGVIPSEDRDCIEMQSGSNLKIRNVVFDNCQFGQYRNVFSCTSTDVDGLVVRGQVFNVKNQFGYFANCKSVIVDVTGYNWNTDSGSIANCVFEACANSECSININNVAGDALVRFNGANGRINCKNATATNSIVAELVDINGTPSRIFNTGAVVEYVPQFNFGGAFDGTIPTKAGEYIVNNGVMDINIYLLFSDKGTGTGDATISLPFSVNTSTFTNAVPIVANGVTSDNYGAFAQVSNGNDELLLRKMTGSASSNMNDTDFTNTSVVIVNSRLFV